jgi:branched-chain amino acid transport system substrate-binding protein
MIKTFQCILLLLFSASLCSAEQSTEKSIRKIGVIAPLSGPLSAIGETVKNSVLLAAEKYSPDHQVEFIIEDDGFVPKNSVSASQRLLGQAKVSGLIVFGSSTSLSVAPIAESKKIPLITMGISESLTKNREYVYRLFMEGKDLAELAAKEIKKRNYSSIATVSTIQDGMIALRDQVNSHSSVVSVLNEEVPPGETDLRTIATKIANLNPSAVLLALLPPQPSALARQLRQIGYNGELFSGPQVQVMSEVIAAQGALKDCWFVTQDDSNADEFFKNYAAQFKDLPMPDGIYGFEAARLMIEGAENGEIQSYLKSIKSFEGIHGKYRLVKPNIFLSPVTVKIITEDGFQATNQSAN